MRIITFISTMELTDTDRTLSSPPTEHLWFYLTLVVGLLLSFVAYLQYQEAELNRKYQKAKFEAKLHLAKQS